jgi:hypothetical protein
MHEVWALADVDAAVAGVPTEGGIGELEELPVRADGLADQASRRGGGERHAGHDQDVARLR